jgi:hypothetical protein
MVGTNKLAQLSNGYRFLRTGPIFRARAIQLLKTNLSGFLKALVLGCPVFGSQLYKK